MSDVPGLRERKKTETRVAIQQAVLFLALGRGLDAVTADEIAAVANVSVRRSTNFARRGVVAAWASERRSTSRPCATGRPSRSHALSTPSARSRPEGERPGQRGPRHLPDQSRWRATGPSSSKRRSGWRPRSWRLEPGPTLPPPYPHCDGRRDLGDGHRHQFTPSDGTAADRGRWPQAFALLRSGLQRGQPPPT
jgi:hypothetical protein